MTKATPHTLDDAFASLTLAAQRTPESTGLDDSFCMLSRYRDGGVFLAHFAGRSEWERHPVGDELVMVVEGNATIVLRIDDRETAHPLQSGQVIVVPQNTWHRFEAPQPVKLMTVTPQPTDHSAATTPAP